MILNHIKRSSPRRIAFAVISPVGSSLMVRLLSQAKLLSKERKLEISIFLFTTVQQYFGENLRQLKNFIDEWSNRGVTVYHCPIKMEGVSIIFQILLFPVRLISFFIFCILFDPNIVHAHSSEAGAIASLFKKLFGFRLVTDILGTVVEEMSMRKRVFCSLAVLVTSIQEKISVTGSDRLIFVSPSLKKYIHYKFHPKIPSIVIPSCVDFNDYSGLYQVRVKIRNELSIQDKFVVLFSGTFFEWQNSELITGWLTFIKTLLHNAFILILTNNNVTAISSILEKIGLERQDFAIRKLAHDAIPNYLSAADLGLLIRKQSIVSQVASPLKYCEYLASGVPVLSHRGIDLVERDLVRFPSVGFLLNSNSVEKLTVRDKVKLTKFLQEVKRNRSVLFRKCQDLARKQYNWNDKTKKILDLYSG